MFKLEKGLKEWVTQGLITQDQAGRIQTYESQKPESSWILSGLLILGSIIIGIGIVSLIAANWIFIPNAVKLGVDFILLTSLAVAAYKFWHNNKPIYFEVILLSFILFCMASIGLISQIYNTGGKLYQALLLWSFITWGASLAARQFFIPFLWTGILLASFISAVFDHASWIGFYEKNYQAVFMTIPFLCASLTLFSKQLAGEIGATRAFRSWILITGLVGLSAFEMDSSQSYLNTTSHFLGYALAAITVAGLALNKEYKKLQKVLLFSTIAVFLISFNISAFTDRFSLTLGVCTIFVLSFMAVFLASIKEQKLFQAFLSFIGIRFLIFYFQVFGGLATTGFGLIISGIFVISMAILWNKYRKPLSLWVEGKVQ